MGRNFSKVFGFADSGKTTLSNAFLAMADIFRFIYAYIRVKPEIVHIATAYGASFLKHSIMALFSSIFGSKVILAPHCSVKVFIPERPRSYRNYIFFVLKKCKGIIVLSSEWLSLVPLLPDVEITYLPNAINCSEYLEIERTFQISSPINIVYLGHIGKEKGSFDLIYAARILRDRNIFLTINLYGESLVHGEIEEINRLILDFDLSEIIKINPPVFNNDKIVAFQHADIYILPSYHEGMPISVIEAMASGLPVVATSVGGIPDLVTTGENGFLVPVSCPEAIAESLLLLISNPSLRYQMGMQSRERASRKHDIKSYVEQLVSYYKLLV